MTPIERTFGFGRGQPVDRAYIESFLGSNALVIEGAVLEIGDAAYTKRFGGDRVTRSDVLNVSPSPSATIVADLADADHLPSSTFDCIICTQTLQLVYDVDAAVAALYRMLRPGGVLLITVPGISQTDDPTWQSTWYWSFTTLSVERLLRERCNGAHVDVRAHGNVLTSVAFLHGLSADELTTSELAAHDPSYPLLITAKAIKPAEDTGHAGSDLVSVVVPCFDQAHFLGEAIESALEQSGGPIEVIVVDDGSTDNTAAVVGRYAGVQYIHQRHQGLPVARNTGLARTTGRFVVFLDADDRLAPCAFVEGRRHLYARRDCAFVSGSHRLVDVDGAVMHECRQPPLGRDPFAQMLKGNYISMGAAVMYRREVFDLIGGFDPALPACEDYDVYLRIMRRFPVCAHDNFVADYRRHGQAMTDNAAVMLSAVVRVLESQRSYVTGDPAHEGALAEGLAYWRGYYGGRCAEAIVRNLRASKRRLAVRQALTLARHAPAQLRHVVADLLTPVRTAEQEQLTADVTGRH